jgi:hypothetical protein
MCLCYYKVRHAKDSNMSSFSTQDERVSLPAPIIVHNATHARKRKVETNKRQQVKRTSTDDNDLQPENNISQNSIPDPKRNRLEQVARDTDESNEEVPNNHEEALQPAVPHLDAFRQPSEPNILAFFGRSQSIEESLEKMNRGPKAKVINDR